VAHRIALKVMLVCALVLAAIAMLAASPAHYPHTPTICPGPSSPGDGTPVIRPRNDCTPSFTEQDARSYLAANLQLALANAPNDIAVVGHPQIISIRFVSMRDLSRAPYAPVWLVPSDRIVCYVVLDGTFFALHLPPHHPLLHFPRPVFIVFDAHSGNLLGNGFGDPRGP